MTLAQARRIALYLLAVLVLSSVIAFPDRSAEFVRLGFEAVSAAADGTAALLTSR